MATESDLIDLLGIIGDRAPRAEDTVSRLMLAVAPTAPSHRRWLPIGAVIAAVAVSIAVSVVVRGDYPHPGAVGAGPTAAVDHATYPLPLDAYYASAAQERTLRLAQFVLVQRCAQVHGVTVPTARFPAVDPKPAFLATIANDVRPLTLRQARTIGYDLYPAGISPVQAVLAGLTAQQLEIFYGWSSDLKLTKPTSRFLLDGGCFGQADQKLLMGAKPAPVPGRSISKGLPELLFADDATVDNIYLTAARSGETSPRVREAQKSWSACMGTHGYPGLHTTEDAIQNISNPQSGSAKRQAVQDVQCKQSTGFVAVWIASMTRAQNAVIAAHRSQLAGFKQRLATRMANATEALK